MVPRKYRRGLSAANTGSSFLQWCTSSFLQSDGEQKCILAAFCWAIWVARNNLVWQGKVFNPSNVVVFATKYLEQWRNARKSNLDSSWSELQMGDGNGHWTPPTETSLKVDVDATLFNGGNSYGIGMVARNHDGVLIEARTVLSHGAVDPPLAEAIGLKEALSWIKDMQWQNVSLESDCLVAIQAIRSSLKMHSLFGLVIRDCKTLFNTIGIISVVFVKRSANVVAYNFAKAAMLFPNRRFSLEDVPTDLLSCLVAEVIG
ncbi:uncharacterized protein LOC133030484 [Cannabis sativa]|uniref:uncharacterized protein LOC133030484 n=1 Tax=Cannabis sativa TaxID=3483 RepID=UPI0029C9E5AF|nr:uncharacterized protein LOC133030484 [Cannabis sativa]